MLYLEQNDLDAALADFNHAIELEEEMVLPYVYRAGVYIEKGEPEKALSSIEQALAIDPHRALGFFYRAKIYDAQEKKQAAIDDYKQFLEYYDAEDHNTVYARKRIRELGDD